MSRVIPMLINLPLLIIAWTLTSYNKMKSPKMHRTLMPLQARWQCIIIFSAKGKILYIEGGQALTIAEVLARTLLVTKVRYLEPVLAPWLHAIGTPSRCDACDDHEQPNNNGAPAHPCGLFFVDSLTRGSLVDK
jgi:hypothetical protein